MNDNPEEDARSESEAGDNAPPPKYRIRRFLQWQLKNASKVGLASARYLVDADYSPESLERLERYSPQHQSDFHYILDWSIQHGYSNSEAQLWLLYLAIGSYFGDVLVKNLGGRWKYPSRVYAILALLLYRPAIAYRHWYVVVGKQKVPVVELARRRNMMGSDESLFRAYQTIAKGAFKNYPQGPQYPSKNP